ncbi:MAG: ATP-binding protein [bacterium]|nr:ATP-binding protein [bacterium]
MDREIYQNQDTPPKVSIEKACNEINSIFEKLDLSVWLKGLRTDGSRMPIFTNSSGKEFNITGLSSGEKQLFFRIMALKMVEANNSIILVDEPEISLHPSWQQKILKVYETVGKNNQIIVGTHSPHVVSAAKKESVRLLKKADGGISVLDYNDNNEELMALGLVLEAQFNSLTPSQSAPRAT